MSNNKPIKRSGTHSDGKGWAFTTWGDENEADYASRYYYE